MLKSGAKVAFGSDWFVSSLNPFDGIEIAVTHQCIGDNSGETFLPEQKISLGDAIKTYTAGSSYVNFLEDRCGSLKAGMDADFIILSKNPFQIDPKQIHSVQVLHTFLDGKCVFSLKQ